MLTIEDISRLRAIAEADRNGADGKAWDGAVIREVVSRLCDALERLDKEAEWLAHWHTNAVDISGICPLNEDAAKCGKTSCMSGMRKAARKAAEKA